MPGCFLCNFGWFHIAMCNLNANTEWLVLFILHHNFGAIKRNVVSNSVENALCSDLYYHHIMKQAGQINGIFGTKGEILEK